MNTSVVYGLVTISALLATAMRLTRKYVMKYMSNYSIIIIDAIITGMAMIITALYMGGLDQLKKDLTKLHGTTLLSPDKNVPYWNPIILRNNVELHYGSKKNGDLYDIQNLLSIIKSVGKSTIDIITGDGGFD